MHWALTGDNTAAWYMRGQWCTVQLKLDRCLIWSTQELLCEANKFLLTRKVVMWLHLVSEVSLEVPTGS